MGSGPGHLQTAINGLLAADPDRAWRVDDLAAAIYGQPVEKKHRVALLRVLHSRERMPNGWHLYRTWVCDRGLGTPYRLILANEFSLKGMLRVTLIKEGGDEVRPALAERIRQDVAFACRMRDAESSEERESIRLERDTADDACVASYTAARATIEDMR